MVKILIRILATAAAIFLISNYIPGIAVVGWYAAFVAAVLWGFLSLFVKPILNILTLPINLITFGLFSFILNALLFWFMGTVVAGFTVAGFVPALQGSVVLTVLAWVLNALL